MEFGVFCLGSHTTPFVGTEDECRDYTRTHAGAYLIEELTDNSFTAIGARNEAAYHAYRDSLLVREG